jgi:hypothetical protein
MAGWRRERAGRTTGLGSTASSPHGHVALWRTSLRRAVLLTVVAAVVAGPAPVQASPTSLVPPYGDGGWWVESWCGGVAACMRDASADAATGRLRASNRSASVHIAPAFSSCVGTLWPTAAAWVADELQVTGRVKVHARVQVDSAVVVPGWPLDPGYLYVSLQAGSSWTGTVLAPLSSGQVVLTTPPFAVDTRDGQAVRVPVKVSLFAISAEACRKQAHALDGSVTVTSIEAVPAS